MADFLLLTHGDGGSESDEAWGRYLAGLRATGKFQGGSSIGAGACFRRTGAPAPLSAQLTGYLKVEADSLEAAQAFLHGNPAYEAGATVEIRELPQDG
jgi:hypothetical protein